MPVKTILVANIAEAFENIISKIKSPRQKNERIRIEHNLCERSLLWEEDDKVIITPFPISKKLINHNKKILGLKNVYNFFPQEISISLSEAILQDSNLINFLCNLIKENPGVRISPYCVTKKFLSLIKYLNNRKLDFDVQEMPKDLDASIVSYLDSKAGSRTEVSKIKDKNVKIPRSITCKSVNEAIKATRSFYDKSCSCIWKANFGESGWGLIIVNRKNFKDWHQLVEHLKKELKDPIWERDLILVEEYIIQNQDILTNSPSLELFVSEKGTEITYLCSQMIGKKGDFLGVTLGKNFLPLKLENKLIKASLAVGNKFHQLGYRGFFDIDFVVSNNGIPYIIETNTRRTGGTHAYDVTKLLFGNSWEENTFVIAQDSFQYGNKRLSPDEILGKMKQVLYPIKGTKEGIIISIINRWKPCFGFVIVGNTKTRAFDIYNKMLTYWELKSN